MKPEKKNNENAASTISNMRVQLQRLQQHQFSNWRCLSAKWGLTNKFRRIGNIILICSWIFQTAKLGYWSV